MKKYLLLAILTVVSMTVVKAQCPFTPTITTVGTEPSCTSTVYRFKTEAGNSTYQWTTSGTFLYSTGQYDTVSVYFPTAGSYTLGVKYTKNGCTPSSPTVKTGTINGTPILTLTPSPAAPQYCSGVTLTYTAPSGPTISNYQWRIPTGFPFLATGTIVSGTLTSSTIQIQWTATQPNTQAAVSVSYDDSSQPCKAFASSGVMIYPALNTNVSGPSAVCVSASGTFTASGSDSQSLGFQWTVTGGPEGTTNYSTTTNTLIYTPPSPGTRTISVTFTRPGAPCALQVGTPKTVVTPTPTPVTITAPPSPVCIGTSLDYVATAGFASYQWQIIAGSPEIDATYGTTSPTLRLKWTNNLGLPFTIQLVATDAYGCRTTAVTTGNTKGPTMVVAPGSSVCASGSTVFNINGTVTGTPTWTMTGGGGTVTSQTSNSATISWTNIPGPRVITFTGNLTSPDGCILTPSNPVRTVVVIATPPTAPVFTVNTSENSLCKDGIMGFIISSPPPPPTGQVIMQPVYSWSVNAPDKWEATGTQTQTGFPARVRWGTTAGSRTVTLNYTDGMGCAAPPTTNTYTVVTTPTISITSPTNGICSNQTATLTANGGNTPYTWSYNGPAGSYNLAATAAVNTLATPVMPGDYTVSSTVPNACKVTSTPFSLAVAPVPTITTDSGISWFCDGASLLLKVQYPAGIPYQWKLNGVDIPGATGPTYTASVGGNYTVATTSPASCIGYGVNGQPFAVQKIGPLLGTLTSNKPQTCGAGTTVTLSMSGDTYGFSFTLEKYNASTSTWSTYQNYFTSASATSGKYRAKASSTYGCSYYSNTLDITDGTKQIPVFTPSGTVGICSGGSLQLSVNSGFQSYQWYRANVMIPGATSSTYTATQTGTYSMEATDVNGCSSYTPGGVYIGTTYPNPTVTLSATGALSICPGGSVLLSTDTGLPSYTWFKDGNPIAGVTTPTYTATETGSYTVLGKNANNCTTLSNAIAINVKALPSSNVSIVNNTPTTFCNGGNVVLRADDGDQWQWRRDNVDISGATSQQYTAATSGSYTCFIQKVACGVVSNAIPVTVLPLPSATITPLSPTAMCSPGVVSLRAGTGVSYQWKVNGVPNGAPVTTTDKSFFVDGSFTVDVTGANGCVATSAPQNVTFYPLPTKPVINVSGPTTFCDGSGNTTTLSTSAVANGYAWYRGGAVVGSSTSYGVSNITQGGTYYLGVQDALGCTNQSDGVTITVNPQPGAYISPSPSVVICSGSSATLSAAPTGAGVVYQWYRNGNINLGTAATQSVNMAGAYTVKTTYTANGCSSMSSGTLASITSLPATPTITQTGSCTGGTVTLSGNVSGSAYLWSTGATTSTITVSTTGTYTLKVMNSSGCWSATGSTVVSSISSPSFSLNTSGTICQNGQVIISVANVVGTISSVSWSPLAGSSTTITVYEANTYTCTVTFVGGCQVSRSVLVRRVPANCPIPLMAADEPTIDAPMDLDVITESSFYPNPADREINLITPTAPIARKVSLINMQGVEVQTSIIPANTAKTTFPLGSLADGMYIIQIQSNDKFERLKVIINQKR